MFKAKIVLNNNGKQTVLEFDNEKEYYDYLETHPEINQSFNWNWPAFGRNDTRFDNVNKLIDNRLGNRLGYRDEQPMALVKRDMQRMEEEEKRSQREKELLQRRKEQEKKELQEAKELLGAYRQKPHHNIEYAKRLEEEIERLEKRQAE